MLKDAVADSLGLSWQNYFAIAPANEKRTLTGRSPER